MRPSYGDLEQKQRAHLTIGLVYKFNLFNFSQHVTKWIMLKDSLAYKIHNEMICQRTIVTDIAGTISWYESGPAQNKQLVEGTDTYYVMNTPIGHGRNAVRRPVARLIDNINKGIAKDGCKLFTKSMVGAIWWKLTLILVR